MAEESGYLFTFDDAVKEYETKAKDIETVRNLNTELKAIYDKYFDLVLNFKDQEERESVLYQLNILSGVQWSINANVKMFDLTMNPKERPELYK